MTRRVQVLKDGMGVNSMAMKILIERLVRLGQASRPDAVVFCDTGSEMPETYAYIPTVEKWLAAHKWPPLTRLKWWGPHTSLEAACLKNRCLPSIAYGRRGCTVKWKVQPTDRWIKKAYPGREPEYLIGYDEGESRRWRKPCGDQFVYPLVENGLNRESCIGMIQSEGLPVPIKSSCFFCPSMKRHEIVLLAWRHPELLKRALALEANANLTKIAGLGRRWSWREFCQECGVTP